MTNTNGFDDFDTQVTAEEFYAGWTEDEADYHAEWRDEQKQEDVQRDESLMGGKYHGPSNEAGLTAREYWESRYEYEDEQARLRDEW